MITGNSTQQKELTASQRPSDGTGYNRSLARRRQASLLTFHQFGFLKRELSVRPRTETKKSFANK